VANFRHFAKNPLENNIWSQVPCFSENHSPKTLFKKSPEITTIANTVKACLRFFYFHILNIAKFGKIYTYG
jgi:hypothetical protein